MLRALGLRKAESSANLAGAAAKQADENVNVILEEFHDFELTLQAMDYVLDDQSAKGVQIINNAIKEKGRLPIFVLGLGVIEFIEATLGFEVETMNRAKTTLTEAEALSTKMKNHHERSEIRTSSIYPPGTEYAVTSAESNLLVALIMLLSENVIESAKALYRLRKAYHTLDDINKSIQQHNRKRALLSKQNASVPNLSGSMNASKSTLTSFSDLSLSNNELTLKEETHKEDCFAHVPVKLSSKQRSDIKILKMAEKIYQLKKSRFVGSNIGNSPASDRHRTEIGYSSNSLSDNESNTSDFVDAEEDVPINTETTTDAIDLQAELLGKLDSFTIDEFIHSGVNLCFGILQVVLSLIPPAIGRVLSIVGFKGSRENGLQMLWDATRERNIHGGIATLGLLVFYDGPFQFTDNDFDIPTIEGDYGGNDSIQHVQSRALDQTGKATLLHPGHKLEVALLRGRAYFPNSSLWLLQEGRMLAGQGKLHEAVALMDSATDGTSKEIEMKQLKALLMFDKAMILVYIHHYERAAEHFLMILNLNSWSHGLYTYMAACCYLECYRMCRLGIYPLKDGESNEKKQEEFKKLAEKYLLKAPSYLEGAKKGFFQSKQMPMDRYFMRKVAGIKKMHANYPDLDLVDCVGTSLAHELCYFWNAFNRMDAENLELSLKLLGYSADVGSEYSINTEETNYAKIKETEQQSMLRYFLQTLTLRRLGKVAEGTIILDQYVINDKILIFEVTDSAGGASSIKSKSQTLNSSIPSRYVKRTDDPWLYPTALYERAIFCWKTKGMEGIDEVKEWLQKALNYADDYELSARTGMHIKAAMDRLDGY
ncbi:hypothetical protein DASC09_062930 [Saccharomycopsis crataegensis]|uniref:Inclusion body clearance protein IML2 n=1 Tax=Saccharomycopsis crataegensis TaxID=43959 RepID=A0AAV5QWN4_9ASCO|nr:hypothetical protein DASC09_062930 [Saccharomycopsis crataegensis]